MGFNIKLEAVIFTDKELSAMNRCIQISQITQTSTLPEFFKEMGRWDIFHSHDVIIGMGSNHIWVSRVSDLNGRTSNKERLLIITTE